MSGDIDGPGTPLYAFFQVGIFLEGPVCTRNPENVSDPCFFDGRKCPALLRGNCLVRAEPEGLRDLAQKALVGLPATAQS